MTRQEEHDDQSIVLGELVVRSIRGEEHEDPGHRMGDLDVQSWALEVDG